MHNKTVTRQSSSQRKSRRLTGKLHCLNFVFPAKKNETLGPVCLGCKTLSSSVSLSMLKVPIKEVTSTSLNSNYKSSHVASNFMVTCLLNVDYKGLYEVLKIRLQSL